MKTAMAGAGAMGSRFGYMLSQAGKDVILIDQWEENVKTIREKGLQVNKDGEVSTIQIPIYYPSELEALEIEVDLIIVFVKSLQLEGMLQAIQPIIKPRTSVLCLLNGIGHETILERYVSTENAFLGNTMWTAGLEGPGKVKLLGSGSVALQNRSPESKERAVEIAALLSEAGLKASYSDHVIVEIYKKACANGSTNALCTLLDANLNTFGNTSCAEDIVRAFIDEYADVAAVEGVVLDREAITAFVKSAFDPSGIGRHYPSMYQDLMLNKRLTEIDCINGIIVEKGKRYGIKTPYCAFITQLIHCKEEIMGVKPDVLV